MAIRSGAQTPLYGRLTSDSSEPAVSIPLQTSDLSVNGASKASSGSGNTFYWSAFAQGWLATGFGARIGSGSPGGPFYEGRNFGMTGPDGARLRRAEVAADGKVSSRLYYRGMVDLARAFDGGARREVLQDLFAGYRLDPEFSIEVGRQNIGMGIEGTTDDSRLLTISRSIMNEDLPVHVGRLGDMRSTGAMLRYKSKALLGFVGIWNDPSSARLGLSSSRPAFANVSITYTGIDRLNASLFGGTHVFSNGGETTDRVGGAAVWQRGPHIVQAEVEFARDYAPLKAASPLVGTAPIGGYILYGYNLSKRLQLVIRYDNFDEGQQRVGASDEITETGLTIPHANHKLREYTIGFNYYVDDNQRVQLNLVREDPEDNGYVYWGPQRTLLMAEYQIGIHTPNRPDALRGANSPITQQMGAGTNAVYIGANFAPTLGYSAGVQLGVSHMRLVSGMQTRATFGVLGDAHAPSIFGFPGTTYMVAVDQITHNYRFGRNRSAFSIYSGFGAGGYFQHELRPGARLLIGANVTRSMGIELISNITGAGSPYVSFLSRFPL